MEARGRQLIQLVVLSGKGGTGKTTVTAALAHLASQDLPIILADADVDAANLELVLAPTVQEEHAFRSGQLAIVDPIQCTGCGRCQEICRFDAVLPGERYQVDALACEGCAACFYQCPVGAIRMEEQQAGCWFRSDTRYGPLFHAHLYAGQENSGKLVTQVKGAARSQAAKGGVPLLLIDGPPGIGCPVISASAGADLALLVVEPTVSGVHDLERALATTDHFRVPARIVINKADLSLDRAQEIRNFCVGRGVEVVGQVPYDDVVTQAMVYGHPVTEHTDGPVTQSLRELWARIRPDLFPNEATEGSSKR
jgi:MinD superfamily P-loop ATPase